MPQPIVVSGSDAVKGDISSCKTEATVISGSSRDSIWTEANVSYATNNCTGKTDIYYSWSFTGFTFAIGVAVVFLIVCWLIAWANKDSY